MESTAYTATYPPAKTPARLNNDAMAPYHANNLWSLIKVISHVPRNLPITNIKVPAAIKFFDAISLVVPGIMSIM